MLSCMENWRNEYLQFDKKYENHVNKFITYLNSPDVNKSNTPAHITIEDVDSCICYYNRIGKINSINSMANHLEAVKAFYSYMIRKGYINFDIFQNIDYADFKENLTIKYSLKSPKEREHFEDVIICEILDCIDNYFYNIDYEKLSVQKKTQYLNRISLRIFIKLGLIAPAKKNVIVNIALKDFCENYRFLTINNVKIRIPNSLRNNIISALDFKKKHSNVIYDDNTLLFNYLIYGETTIPSEKRISNLESKFNDWLCVFLKQYDILDIPKNKRSYSVEAIMNTTMHNLVKNGANPYYISKISGITIGTLEKKYYKEKECINYIVKVDNEINHGISKSEYYHYI